MGLLGNILAGIHRAEAGIGRQINPFDNGATYGNPNPINHDVRGYPDIMPHDPLGWSLGATPKNNTVPYVLHGGVPLGMPNNQPIHLGPNNSIEPDQLRAMPLNPDQGLYNFPSEDYLSPM